MKNKKLTLLILFSLWLGSGCKKEIVVSADAINFSLEYPIPIGYVLDEDFLPMDDNSFYVICRLQYYYNDLIFFRFDHNLRLLDSVSIDKSKSGQAGNFVTTGNKIYNTSLQQIGSTGSVILKEFDEKLKLKMETNLLNYLNPNSDESLYPDPNRYSTCVGPTGEVFSGFQLANYPARQYFRYPLFYFKNDIGTQPVWINAEIRNDSFQKIQGCFSLNMRYSKNKLYSLCYGWSEDLKYYSYFPYIKILDASGNLVKQKVIQEEPISSFSFYTRLKLWVDEKGIIVYNSASTFMLDPNLTKVNKIDLAITGLVPLSDGTGYLATLGRNENSENTADVVLLDNNLQLIKQRTLGGYYAKGTKYIGKLANGEYVVYFESKPGNKASKFTLIKIDKYLNIK